MLEEAPQHASQSFTPTTLHLSVSKYLIENTTLIHICCIQYTSQHKFALPIMCLISFKERGYYTRPVSTATQNYPQKLIVLFFNEVDDTAMRYTIPSEQCAEFEAAFHTLVRRAELVDRNIHKMSLLLEDRLILPLIEIVSTSPLPLTND